jgi:hypothetical protein
MARALLNESATMVIAEEGIHEVRPGEGLWRPVLEWLGNRRTVRMFREDRLLAAMTLTLAAVSLIPVFVTPFLPLVDLGSNVGAAGLIDDVLRHREVPYRFFSINRLPVPYWSGYLLLDFFEVLTGPFIAAKATVVVTVLLLPVSHMRLLAALGRSPRLGLWAFLLAWDVNTYWGWFTFQLGMGLAFYALAWIVETSDWKSALCVAPLTSVIALTHPHAIALLGVGAIALAAVKPRPLRALRDHCIALGGNTVLLPWLVTKVLRHEGSVAQLDVQDAALTEKVASLYRYSLDTLPAVDAANLTALAFLLLIFGPVLLGAMKRRATTPRSTAMAVAILATCVGLYVFFPFAVNAPVVHWWTYPRYATYILLALLLLPAPTLRGAQLFVLLPGLTLAVAMTAARTRQFSAYGTITRPYLDIIHAMRSNSTFLPLDFAFDWPGTREWSLGQLHGYVASAKSSFDPHLFGQEHSPIIYRASTRLPAPDWQRLAETFNMQDQGRFYDYIITHPRSLDIVAKLPPEDVELIIEAGEWRLYEVKKH